DYEPYKTRDINQNICEDMTAKESKSRTRNVTKSKCILCVDDDSISLESTLQQITKLGYSTVSTTNGQDAVKLVDSELKLDNTSSSLSNSYAESHKISLILIEYNLPIMSGFDVSRAIRAMRPPISNIPIIILTTLPVEEMQNKFIESGINDYLSKPLKIEELEKILTKWIGDT
ncbi:5565_t:CDS:2, partial [Gigaspora margarita]